jgi:hypothetical protein
MVIVNWDNEQKTALRFDFTGQWQWFEYFFCLRDAIDMISDVDHSVDLIFNMGESRTMPGDVLAVGLRTFDALPLNTGKLIFCRGDIYVNAAAILFSRLYPHLAHRIAATTSLVNARLMLQQAGIGA